MGRQQNASK